MIQRIQSVYLLLAAIALIIAMCLPAGYFVGEGGLILPFKPLGIAFAEGTFQSTWGLFGILLLSAVTACCTLLLFRNRKLQMRMTVFNSILLIGYYIAFGVFVYVLNDDSFSFRFGWALSLPLICIILNYLAYRSIHRDDEMVKAVDRIR